MGSEWPLFELRLHCLPPAFLRPALNTGRAARRTCPTSMQSCLEYALPPEEADPDLRLLALDLRV